MLSELMDRSELPEYHTWPRALVLGTAQDGGFPHAGCVCEHCDAARRDPTLARRVACLGLVSEDGRSFLVDATPDIGSQVLDLPRFSGLLLTHAHMGHVAGLLQLGKEAMAVKKLPVFLGERLRSHLTQNEPWASLFRDEHLVPYPIANEDRFDLASGLSMTVVEVPHRAEWSETFAFRVTGPERTLLYLPDIDFLTADSLSALLEGVDLALIDGTFYAGDELKERDMSEVPHPLVEETMALMETFPFKAAVSFTHLNHSNPLVLESSDASRELGRGYALAGVRPATAGPVARDGEALAL